MLVSHCLLSDPVAQGIPTIETEWSVRQLCVERDDEGRPKSLKLRLAKVHEPTDQAWMHYKIEDDAKQLLTQVLECAPDCSDHC